MDSRIVSIEFSDDEKNNAYELFNEFCKLKKIRKDNIVSVNYARDFDNRSSILLAYEGIDG